MKHFTATEAATIIGLGIKEINNTIDKENFLGANGKQTKARYLDIKHLLYMQIKWELKETELAMNLKKRIFEEITSNPRRKTIHPASIMAIDLGEVRHKVAHSMIKFWRAHRIVKSDPSILGGEPVIKGTRIPVYLIGRMVAEGTPVSSIQKSYPSLTAEQIEYAAIYSNSYPRRGRTPKFFWHTEKPVSTAKISLE